MAPGAARERPGAGSQGISPSVLPKTPSLVRLWGTCCVLKDLRNYFFLILINAESLFIRVERTLLRLNTGTFEGEESARIGSAGTAAAIFRRRIICPTAIPKKTKMICHIRWL